MEGISLCPDNILSLGPANRFQQVDVRSPSYRGCERMLQDADPKLKMRSYSMVIDTGVLECAKLEKVCRRKNVPKLLEIIQHYHGERHEAALNQIEDLGVILESDTRSDALKSLVRDTMEVFRAGQKPIIVGSVHRDGKDFAYAGGRTHGVQML